MRDDRRFFRPIERSDGFDPTPARPALVARKTDAAVRRQPPKPRSPTPSLPPGQARVSKAPVLDIGHRPLLSPKDWSLTWGGRCARPGKMTWVDLEQHGLETFENDIHCVTGWSKTGNTWRGVALSKLLQAAGPPPNATHLIAKGFDGYGTVISLMDAARDGVFLATEWDGRPLPRDHGGPVRLVVPHLYFWKSAKWIKQLWFTEGDPGGYWENRGYHHRGDPWKNERYQ